MKVFKIEVMVLDFENSGEEGVISILEDVKYANVTVKSVKSVDVDWSDEHPLNHSKTQDAEFQRLFERKQHKEQT